jgi:beta-carotene 3-hydroxylase
MLGSMYAVWPVMYIVWYFGMELLIFLFIHQRFKWFRNSDNVYFRAIRSTQSAPQTHGKRTRECFGMLIVPWKYLRQELKKNA